MTKVACRKDVVDNSPIANGWFDSRSRLGHSKIPKTNKKIACFLFSPYKHKSLLKHKASKRRTSVDNDNAKLFIFRIRYIYGYNHCSFLY